MKRGRVANLVLGASVACAFIGAFWASECPEDRRPMEMRLKELPSHYSVFAGRAVRVTVVEPGMHETEFRVAKSWRGITAPRLKVLSNVAVLGPSFEAGQDYLVFAYSLGSTAALETDVCSGTSRLSEAAPWLAVLGQPRFVVPDAEGQAPK